MTFCKEMSSRLEEPFCKNICFLGIDTISIVQICTCFGTHVIIQTRDIIKGVLVGNEAKEANIQKI